MTFPNIVMLDTDLKTVGGREVSRPAIIVGVVEKKPNGALTAHDFPIPPFVEVDVTQGDGTVMTATIPTDVVETGEIVGRSLEWRARPCPGGFRIEPRARRRAFGLWHERSKGTLGVTTYFRNERCLLSNCHVIGDYSDGPGLNVYQPSFNPWSAKSRDRTLIAVCDGTMEIISYPTKNPQNIEHNIYDFAWAEVPANQPLEMQTSHAIQYIHEGENWLRIKRNPRKGDKVSWVGATTGLVQYGTIRSTRSRIAMPFRHNNRWAFWEEVIRIDKRPDELQPVMMRGDSGSALIRDADKAIVGLLSFSGGSSLILATRIPDEENPAGPQQMRIQPAVF
ncbi:hypothetical protein [Kitasatospora brasiliensis]|uniref:hypothetical protein n=1 Tax=Kitasatospora brasiliensis TaxID=3058040 RepID=UPI00292E5328|nr:hypothetical protein [Kitasatospora sp. K002]